MPIADCKFGEPAPLGRESLVLSSNLKFEICNLKFLYPKILRSELIICLLIWSAVRLAS